MSLATLYSFTDARKITGESPNLITYLVRDRQIPHRVVGKTKLFDAKSMKLLQEAIAEYHGKPVAEVAAASA
jgi:hypothetical protein